jgi:hypothetical protein
MSDSICPKCGLESPELSKRKRANTACDVCKLEAKLEAQTALGNTMESVAEVASGDRRRHGVMGANQPGGVTNNHSHEQWTDADGTEHTRTTSTHATGVFAIFASIFKFFKR